MARSCVTSSVPPGKVSIASSSTSSVGMSRSLVGSSSTSTSAVSSIMRATCARASSPPESIDTLCRSCSSRKRKRRDQLFTCISLSRKRTFSPSGEIASWRSAPLGNSARVCDMVTTRGVGSATRTAPASGASSPVRMRSSVVFPEPFGPMSPMHSPGTTSRSRLRNSSRPPSDFDTPSAEMSLRVRRPLAVKSMPALPPAAAWLRSARSASSARRSALSSMRACDLVRRAFARRPSQRSSSRTVLARLCSAFACISRNSVLRRRNSE